MARAWTIPSQGKNIDAAADFVKWMVAPEQQIEVFKTVGNLPSQPALYKDPAVLDYKKAFMSNAPTGQIFAATAAEPEAAVPGQEGRPDPGRGGERDHPGPAGQAQVGTTPGRWRSRRPRRPPTPDCSTFVRRGGACRPALQLGVAVSLTQLRPRRSTRRPPAQARAGPS